MNSTKRKMKEREIGKYIILKALWIVFSLFVTAKAFELAYQTRGYMAIGGEVFVFPVMLILPDLVDLAIDIVKGLLVKEDEKTIL